jgi:hypothetical protein
MWLLDLIRTRTRLVSGEMARCPWALGSVGILVMKVNRPSKVYKARLCLFSGAMLKP